MSPPDFVDLTEGETEARDVALPQLAPIAQQDAIPAPTAVNPRKRGRNDFEASASAPAPPPATGPVTEPAPAANGEVHAQGPALEDQLAYLGGRLALSEAVIGSLESRLLALEAREIANNLDYNILI